jgi:hypothetical protein
MQSCPLLQNVFWGGQNILTEDKGPGKSIFPEAVQMSASVNQIKNKKREIYGQARRAHPQAR